MENGGAEGNRTPDLIDANDALSQLSYGPVPERLVVWLALKLVKRSGTPAPAGVAGWCAAVHNSR
jgi:hypothetical protein